MDIKFLGWISYPPKYPMNRVLNSLAEFQNELAAEGYVTYMTYVTAEEEISDEIGIVFSSEPVTKEEAQEAFKEFLLDEEDEDVDEEYEDDSEDDS